MSERMLVFEPGDRLATMSLDGTVHTWVVDEDGLLDADPRPPAERMERAETLLSAGTLATAAPDDLRTDLVKAIRHVTGWADRQPHDTDPTEILNDIAKVLTGETVVDVAPLPENVNGHALGARHLHDDGRRCGWHPGLACWVIDPVTECLREHP